VFSLTSVCFNLGAMVGPLVGVVVFAVSPSWTFACAAAVYVVSFVALRVFVPRTVRPDESPPARGDARAAVREILTHRRLLAAALLITTFWVVFSQFQFSVPVVVTALDPVGGTTTVATLFALNGGIIVAFSMPLTRALEKRPARTVMVWGFVLTLLGYLLLAAAPHAWIHAPVVVLTLGEILFTTFANTHVAAIAPPHRLATYLGLLGLLSGVGTAMGNALSGALLAPLLAAGLPWLLWVIFVGFAALPLVALLVPRCAAPKPHKLIETSSNGR
jgi:DHA1 family multidrug resistance protein-like MFS transporter